MYKISALLKNKDNEGILEIVKEYINKLNDGDNEVKYVVIAILIASFYRLHDEKLVESITELINESKHDKLIKLCKLYTEDESERVWNFRNAGVNLRNKWYPEFHDLAIKYENNENYDIVKDYKENVESIVNAKNFHYLLLTIIDHDLHELFDYVITIDEYKNKIIEAFYEDNLMFSVLHSLTMVNKIKSLDSRIENAIGMRLSLESSYIINLNKDLECDLDSIIKHGAVNYKNGVYYINIRAIKYLNKNC